jgi:hypothetical protein
MVTNMSGIQRGMDVIDANGSKVGTISDVLTVQAFSQESASDPYGTGGGTSGAALEGTILKVLKGGLLGIGGTDLYIPVKDVQSVVPGENLTINCSNDACDNLYSNRPDFLGDAV